MLHMAKQILQYHCMASLHDSKSALNVEPELIVWVPVDEKCGSVRTQLGTSIFYPFEAHINCPPWFEATNVERLQRELGTDYASGTNTSVALHQGVVTLEVLRCQYPYSVLYTRSPAAALGVLSNMSEPEKKKAIVWLNGHYDIHPHTWMTVYDTLSHECGSIYPRRNEIVRADFKIYDVRAFDRIAARTEAYRPLTCYPARNMTVAYPNMQRAS
jgi:hypothetical protein